MTYGHRLSARRCMRNQEVANILEPHPSLPRSSCLQLPLTKARFLPTPPAQPSLQKPARQSKNSFFFFLLAVVLYSETPKKRAVIIHTHIEEGG
ncbi:rCG57025, isoform CRA_b [Rattus norvegicus]|uniref:RCG57025, isoform CRA_b n=1 Tax=Rattus norvegicus TaxID=10116 RepID=A6JCX5_RAT|nr:rCG57025, isoform CRA_b [Rattus norvegicus]